MSGKNKEFLKNVYYEALVSLNIDSSGLFVDRYLNPFISVPSVV